MARAEVFTPEEVAVVHFMNPWSRFRIVRNINKYLSITKTFWKSLHVTVNFALFIWKIMKKRLVFCFSAFALLVFTEWNAAIAGPISIKAYNTGSSTPWDSDQSILINPAGNVSTGVPDPHWQVRLAPGANATAYAVSESYMENMEPQHETLSKSLWITPGNPVASQAQGSFVYTTSFWIPTNYSVPLLIEGMFRSDDGVQKVLVNGAKVLGPYPDAQPYSIKIRATPGYNTLEFFVSNQMLSFTGFDNSFTKVLALPEPSTSLLLICGAGIVIVIRLRSSRYWQAKE